MKANLLAGYWSSRRKEEGRTHYEQIDINRVFDEFILRVVLGAAIAVVHG